MNRRLSETFLSWLQGPEGIKILKTISQYHSLSITMRGKELIVYFQGCKILTIKSKIVKEFKNNLVPLSKAHLKTNESKLISLIDLGITSSNLQQYLDLVISILSRQGNNNHEISVRQEIARVNNRSREANDTDFFVIDQEYGITINKTSKFDLVTLKWASTSKDHKNFSSSNIEIVVFELKLGSNSIGGTQAAQNRIADMKSHIMDFNSLINDKSKLNAFKEDIIKMFIQQVTLEGFYNPQIKALKHLCCYSDQAKESELKKIIDNIPVKFGFILADYKSASKRLKEQIFMFPDDFLFATSSYMGYGLYENSMLNRKQLLEII